ncbi:MAG: hypothetical protein A2096_12095 [Spirochaetes bacterium GWF1_41_5]|nr:MAG: hypothetical protein A2096_12095 [Spirochaetes bacterium GWF1_41_5]HBE03914.1 hypothetical protein [Spirochaetia bacterium]
MIKLFFFSAVFVSVLNSAYQSRIKDIAYISGVKRNILKGYGLVVGLEGSGDSKNPLTLKTIGKYLEHSGIVIEDKYLQTKNCAVVAVTAEMDGFTSKGDMLDVQIASVSDSKSIDNGLLLQTVLRGADNQIYAVVQGIVDTGAGKGGSTRRGMIYNGAVVEKASGEAGSYLQGTALQLILKNPDITTALSLVNAIKDYNSEIAAQVIDYKKISIRIPDAMKDELYKVISEIMQLETSADTQARVVIDKKTGIVVVGDNVRIDAAMISLPGISVEVKGRKINSMLEKNTTAGDLAEALNKLGLKTENIIAVFSALSRSGSLNAQIIVQ